MTNENRRIRDKMSMDAPTPHQVDSVSGSDVLPSLLRVPVARSFLECASSAAPVTHAAATELQWTQRSWNNIQQQNEQLAHGASASSIPAAGASCDTLPLFGIHRFSARSLLTPADNCGGVHGAATTIHLPGWPTPITFLLDVQAASSFQTRGVHGVSDERDALARAQTESARIHAGYTQAQRAPPNKQGNKKKSTDNHLLRAGVVRLQVEAGRGRESRDYLQFLSPHRAGSPRFALLFAAPNANTAKDHVARLKLVYRFAEDGSISIWITLPYGYPHFFDTWVGIYLVDDSVSSSSAAGAAQPAAFSLSDAALSPRCHCGKSNGECEKCEEKGVAFVLGSQSWQPDASGSFQPSSEPTETGLMILGAKSSNKKAKSPTAAAASSSSSVVFGSPRSVSKRKLSSIASDFDSDSTGSPSSASASSHSDSSNSSDDEHSVDSNESTKRQRRSPSETATVNMQGLQVSSVAHSAPSSPLVQHHPSPVVSRPHSPLANQPSIVEPIIQAPQHALAINLAVINEPVNPAILPQLSSPVVDMVAAAADADEDDDDTTFGLSDCSSFVDEHASAPFDPSSLFNERFFDDSTNVHASGLVDMEMTESNNNNNSNYLGLTSL